jgi:hypothetical protein
MRRRISSSIRRHLSPRPARTQTPMHPMQTKSPLALMEPRFAVTDQLRWQNSSWVHRARESCARSPIVRLQYHYIIIITKILIYSFKFLYFKIIINIYELWIIQLL